MFHRITCPSCQHKFTVPESAMGKRVNCPNCQSPFVAGKSVAEAEAEIPMKLQPAAAPALNKTMLGETEPPIRYNCPRCKKPLESPAIEAGTKKPCPACGQRLQVPAAPAPAPPQPALNKTVLAFDETSAPPAGNKPGSQAPAVPQATVLAENTTAQDPTRATAPLFTKRTYMIATIAGGAIFFLSLLTCVLAMTMGGKVDQQALANAQKELEKLRAEIEDRKKQVDLQKQVEAVQQKRWDDLIAEQKTRQRELDLQRDLDQRNLAYQADKNLAADAKAKRDREQADIDRARQDAEQKRNQDALETKARLDSLQKQLEAANQRATTIVNQPPVVYYPPYNPRYYWGW